MAALTESQKEQQLRDAGWTPSQGDSVDQAWARTATPADQIAALGGTPSGGGGGNPSQDKQDILDAFKASSGATVQDLEERKREFDAQMAEREREWTREGLPRLQIDQRLAQLREQEVNYQQQVAQGNLALSFITQAAQMGGPGDVFQAQDFLRGARSVTGLPQWLAALNGNTKLAAFSGPGSEQPIAQSAGLLAEQLAPGVTVQQAGQPGATTPATTAPVAATAAAAPTVAPLGLAEGAFVKKNGASDIGVVRNGQIVGINDWQSFLQMGGRDDLSNVQTIDPNLFETWRDTNAAARAAAAPTDTMRSMATVAPGTAPAGYVAPQNTTVGLGTSPAGYDMNKILTNIGQIFQRGPTGLGPGALESMDDNEVASLQSGGTKLGFDVPAWMRAYQKSRIGQTAAATF